MRKHRSKIINFDDLIGKSEALFLCLFDDCYTSFKSELPKRKNATENLCCPRCKRDFFMYWKDDSQVIVNFGQSYEEMKAIHDRVTDEAGKKNGKKKSR